MKKITIALALCLIASPAYADVYVKVDAQGNAIGGAIMCDAATCGAGSDYSKATLQDGERYVLQGINVDYGIGNNNPDTTVKHDSPTNEWVVSRTQPTIDTPVVERYTVNTPTTTPILEPSMPAPIDETATVTTDTSTVVIDTGTAIIDTATVFSDIDFNSSEWLSRFMTWLDNLITQLYARLEGLKK